MNCPLEFFLLCYPLLVAFVDDDQSFHEVALDKLLAGEHRELYFLDDSFEVKGLFGVGFLQVEKCDVLLFAGGNF